MVHLTDRALLTKAFATLKTAPETLTADQREAVELFGNDADRARLVKADAPTPPAVPSPLPPPPSRSGSLSRKDVREVVEAYLRPIMQELGKQIGPRFAQIEQRLQAHDAHAAKPSVKFCGVWTETRPYAPGDAATFQGGLWICRAATTARPTDDHASWTLAVKRGAAGSR